MTGGRASWRRFLPVAFVLAGLLAAYGLGVSRYLSLDTLAEQRDALRDLVASNRALASLLFVAAYALTTLLLLPGAAIMTITGGFLFGWKIGAALSVFGATLGSAALFLAARSAFANLLRERADGLIRRFADEVRSDAFTYLLVLRLTPILPFSAVNIAPAFLGIRFRTFVAATFLGIIPGATVYALIGSTLGTTLKAAGRGALSPADLLTPKTTAALLGLAALSVLGLVLKKWLQRRRGPAPTSAAVEAGTDA